MPQFSSARAFNEVGITESVICFFKNVLFGQACVYEVPKPVPIVADPPILQRIKADVYSQTAPYSLAEDPLFQRLRIAYLDLQNEVSELNESLPNQVNTRVVYQFLPAPYVPTYRDSLAIDSLSVFSSDVSSFLDCSEFAGGGKLTVNNKGTIVCANDRSGGGSTNTDEQTLTFNDSTYVLSIESGNTVDLSTLASLSTSTLEDLEDVAAMTKSAGDLLYWNGNEWENIATSSLGLLGGGGTVTSVSLTAPTGFSVSGSPVTDSGSITLSYAPGYTGVLSASTTQWQTFYSTPSNRITAGTNIDWSGNSLNVDADLANYNNTNTDFIDLTDLSSLATGLTYTNTTGVFSFAAGYVLPLLASTTQWATAYSWGDHSTSGYLVAADNLSDLPSTSTARSNLGLGTIALQNSDSVSVTGTFDAEASDFSGTMTLSGSAANIALGSNYLSGDGDDQGIYVDSDGDVGIGDSTPTQTLTVTGNQSLSGYLRVGSETAPNNTTAGDLTSTRISVGNTALSGTSFASFTGTLTEGGASSANAVLIQPIFTPASANTSQLRGLNVNAVWTGANTIALGYASNYVNDFRMTGGVTNSIIGFNGTGLQLNANSNNFGTINRTAGASLQAVSSFGNTVTGTISSGVGLLVNDSTITSQTYTGQAGINVGALSAATNNTAILLGTNTIPTGNFSIYNASTNNSYFAGNIGIGTSTPTQVLSVAGANSPQVYFYDSTNNRGASFGVSDGFNAVVDSEIGSTIIKANGATYLTVGSGQSHFEGGNVGIGTSTPESLLHVSGGAGAGALRVGSATGDSFITFEEESENNYWSVGHYDSNDRFAITDTSDLTSGNQRFVILPTSGNVGIGDTTPAALLTVGNGDLFQVNSSGAIAASVGITTTGNITLSGTAANIALGSNFINGDSDDEGISISTAGVVTLSTDLDVTEGGTGVSTLTDHGVLVGSGSGDITALTVGTNGQLLVGSTGADPVFATLNCADGVTCTTGAGTLEIDFDGGNAPGGSLGGTWASPTIDDLFLLNTGDTSSGALTINDNDGVDGETMLTIGDADDLDNLVVFGSITEGGSAVLTAADIDTCAELIALVAAYDTGTCGNVVFSASPTLTGTLTAAIANFSGAVSTGALSATTGTFSGAITEAGSAVLSAADIDTCAELIALVASTGTCGSAVFSASPTFTGTITAAGATMSGTMSWGTSNPTPAIRARHINGKAVGTDTNDTLYLNYDAVGVGVIIGDSGTDHPLTVFGNGTFGGTLTEAGSAVLSAADIDTCAELIALVVSTGTCGSAVFSVSPTLTGNTTVGTLTLTGQLIAGRTDNNFIVTSDTDFYVDLDEDNDGLNDFFIRNGGNTVVFEVDESGNTTIDGNLTLSGTAANIILGSNYLSGDGGDEGIYVDGDGDVGISNPAPEARLDIIGTDILLGDNRTNNTTKYANLSVEHYTIAEESVAMIRGVSSFADGAHSVMIGGGANTQNAANIISFYTGAISNTLTGTLRMGIDQSGYVGIGTLAASPGSVLHVSDTGNANNVLLLQDSSGTCEAQPTTTGLTWSCTSDERIKTNITAPSSVLDYINAIPLHNYNVIATGELVMGPIAQELLTIYPELVTMGEDGYYRVAELSPWQLIKAVQELDAKVNGIALSATTTSRIYVDEAGNIGIDTTTPSHLFHVEGDIAAQSFINVSTKNAKKNIGYLSEKTQDEYLDILSELPLATYLYNSDSKNAPKRLGLIAEDAPKEILSEDGKGVDLYKFVTFLAGATKSLSLEVKQLASLVSGFADSFTTNELCVGEVCVTEDEFKELVENKTGGYAQGSYVSDEEPEGVVDEEVEPQNEEDELNNEEIIDPEVLENLETNETKQEESDEQTDVLEDEVQEGVISSGSEGEQP